MNLPDILDRPIAFYPAFIPLTGGFSSAMMLSQALYWAKRTKNADGWFYKSREEWFDETGLRRSEQETARRRLRASAFWHEELRGVPARLYYRIDYEALLAALLGEDKEVTVEEVIKIYGSVLRALSKTGYMRASKLKDITAEYVDYAKVLKKHGMVCGICHEIITKTIGKKAECLCFDHIDPLNAGGSHVFDNLQPAHSRCNSIKSDTGFQLAYPKPTSRIEDQPTSGISENQQDALAAADLPPSDKPTILITETTTEITSETTNNIDVVLKSNSEINSGCKRLFKFWQELFADVPSVDTSQWKLTKERKMHMVARFRSDLKWTERHLQESLRGMRITPHNLGKNETGTLYIDPMTCFRTDSRVDRYRQTWLSHQRAEEEKKTPTPRKPSYSLPTNLKPANGEWEAISKSMRSQMKDQTFEQWWAPLQCLGMQHEGDMFAFFVNAPNQLVKDWVTNNYIKLIEKALVDANLDPPSVEFCWLIGGDYVR